MRKWKTAERYAKEKRTMGLKRKREQRFEADEETEEAEGEECGERNRGRGGTDLALLHHALSALKGGNIRQGRSSGSWLFPGGNQSGRYERQREQMKGRSGEVERRSAFD